jgi:quercetin dioxygenase-like cupin family protein
MAQRTTPHERGIQNRVRTMGALRASTMGLAIGLAGCGAAAVHAATPSSPSPSATAAATPAPAPPHALIGAFHFSTNDFKIDSDAPSEVVMVPTVIHPGKSSGWHTHPGPAFVIVISGTVTRYTVDRDGSCTSATYGAGQGFVEAPGVVHIARNEGTADVLLQATFLDVAPGTAAFRSPAPAPAACPGIS